MEIKNVKDLKAFLSGLPEGSDEWEVNFTENNGSGVIGIGNATTGHWSDDPEERPEGVTMDFVLLSCTPVVK